MMYSLKSEENKKGRCEYHDSQGLGEITLDSNWVISQLDFNRIKVVCKICNYEKVYVQVENVKPIKTLL